MKKIESLTEAQIAQLPIYRDKWLKIGLSTDPLDFEAAKAAAMKCYKLAGLEAPKYFYRFQSPYSAAIGATMLKHRDQVWAQVGAQVGDQVGDQVWAQVWDQVGAQVGAQVWDQVRAQVGDQVWAQVGDQVGAQVGAQVWDQVRAQVGDQVWAQVWAQVGAQVGDQVRAQVGDQVWAQVGDQVGAQVGDQVRAQVGDQVGDQVWAQVGAQVWDQVGDQVGDQVWAQVWDQVRDQVWAQVGDQVGDQVWAQVYGAHDASWLGFYDFFKSSLNLKNLTPIEGLTDLAKHCGWWAPYRGAVILQDRPSKILFDDQKRLHCEDGPAILYPDGFAIYSWHGVRYPQEWQENPLSPEKALKWGNLEQRRVACEMIGWHNILNKLNAVTIDKSTPLIGELLEVQIPDIGSEKFLRVHCGTGREFALPVPPEMRTAHQANAWTYGLNTEDYHPEVRT